MIILDIFSEKKISSVPFWFMRQAGRYLPEYKKVRSNFPNFLSFCYTPDAACEVTLQPIERFNMSAAIIFSDILVIPDALGMDVTFQESIGPVLVPVETQAHLDALSFDRFEEILAPVYEAIRKTRAALASDKALFGFCGSPWTLACYALQGKSSRDFAGAREFALKEPKMFSSLMRMLSQAVSRHAIRQIEAGADIIQLFDSWSGVLSEREFEDYVIQPTADIIQAIKKKYPSVPVIGFPRLAGEKILRYAQQTGVNGISFDGSVSLDFAADVMPETLVMQGNLDSIILANDRKKALEETKKILGKMQGRKFIFNLAHGILPHTPIENVQAVSDMVQAHQG